MRVKAKLGTMGRAADFVVYPRREDEPRAVILQSSSRICRFDAVTGEGVLSRRCPNGAYFVHLSRMAGAEPVTVPKGVINAALEIRHHKGQEIGRAGGIVIIAG